MEQAHRNDLVTGKTLARIGLGLLLLGIVFLYRWGIENNHIPVEARVGVGVALSLAMLGIGWATRTNRLIFGALLQGGGVAGLFVSAFAAHTVYGLTSEAAVFTQLVFVCALAIGLAVYQRVETLAVVGVVGALAAPQMVGGTILTFPGDAGYVALVLVVVGALLLTNDWTFLYGAASLATGSTFAVELVGLNRGWDFTGPEALFAYGAAFLALWGAPMLRVALGKQQDANIAMTATVTIPVGAFFGAYLTWSNPDNVAWGIAAAVLAVGMSVVFVTLRSRQAFLAAIHMLPASVLGVTAIAFMFDGLGLVLAFAAYGAGYALVGRKIHLGAVEAFGWTVYAVSAARTVVHLFAVPNTGAPVLNETALAQLGIIGLAMPLAATLYSGKVESERPLGQFLFGFAHVAFLIWGLVELSRTEVGQPAVSALWGGYALLIIAVSWSRSRLVRNIGLGTLLVTVVKVFLVDLDNASGGAKILLLIGFGLVLLALGYLMPSDRSGPDADKPDKDGFDSNSSQNRSVDAAETSVSDPFPESAAPRERASTETTVTDPWDFYSSHFSNAS